MPDDGTEKVIVCEKSKDVGDIMFCPPLYKQRYCTVVDFLTQRSVNTIVDFGCAECRLLPLVRRIPTVEKITGVDIDRELLSTRRYILKPLITDYIAPRERPLLIRLFEGSVAQYDSRLRGVQAVTMVEVIEHLEADVLMAFVPVVFGQIQPQYVLITTPNAEFNVLFHNFSGMRHDDHKFEWTRNEFQSWCCSVTSAYPYCVEYGGVGEPPPGKEHVGQCSQYAIFTRNDDALTYDNTHIEETPYNMVLEMEYPHRERLGEEAAILLEADYCMRQAVVQHKLAPSDDYNTEVNEAVEERDDGYSVPLMCLLKNRRMESICTSADKLRVLLEDAGYVMCEGGSRVIVQEEEESDDENSQHNDDISYHVTPKNLSDTEDSWSDDEETAAARQVVPYSMMWEDAEEDWGEDNDRCSYTVSDNTAGRVPCVLDTDPDMVYIPAELHAPAVTRRGLPPPTIDGQFDDDDQDNGAICTCEHQSIRVTCTYEQQSELSIADRAVLEKDLPHATAGSVENGQFDEADEEPPSLHNLTINNT